MPSYQTVIARKLPDLAIGFQYLKLGERDETGELPYRFSYADDEGVVVARLAVEIKEHEYGNTFLSEVRRLYALAHPEEECYLAYYLIQSRRILLFNISTTAGERKNMKDVFRNYRGILERHVYAYRPEQATLDIVRDIW